LKVIFPPPESIWLLAAVRMPSGGDIPFNGDASNIASSLPSSVEGDIPASGGDIP
jgi:hypothetical protein